MQDKHCLVVLDFDGFLVNSYEVIRATFERFGLDLGDEERFRNRRKFLKYVGGGREVVRNLVSYTLPKKKKFRAELTEEYRSRCTTFPEFAPFLNRLIADPRMHVGVVSRNFALEPGQTIRTVLEASGVNEEALDFVIPVPVGAAKRDILAAMRSTRFAHCLLGADEISDYKAASAAGYRSVIGSYGFDRHQRLTEKGLIPEEFIVASPRDAVARLRHHLYGTPLDERAEQSEVARTSRETPNVRERGAGLKRTLDELLGTPPPVARQATG